MSTQTHNQNGGGAARPARISTPKTMWTAALAGGLVGTLLSVSPMLKNRPFLMVSLGGLVAVWVYRTLMRKINRKASFGSGAIVAAMAGLVPGIVHWALLPLTYWKVFVPSVEAQIPAANASPTGASPEQIQAWLDLVRSPAGPWVVGAMTLIGFIFCAMMTGLAADGVALALSPRQPSSPSKEVENR